MCCWLAIYSNFPSNVSAVDMPAHHYKAFAALCYKFMPPNAMMGVDSPLPAYRLSVKQGTFPPDEGQGNSPAHGAHIKPNYIYSAVVSGNLSGSCFLHAGLLEYQESGRYMVTDMLYEAEVHQMLDDVTAHGAHLAGGPAEPIASNITLITACMQALPELLSGAQPLKARACSPDCTKASALRAALL